MFAPLVPLAQVRLLPDFDSLSMLRRFAAPLLVLLPVLLVLGCENNLLEPDLRGAIEGQVFDFDTREPLSGVNITTNPPTGSLITDEERQLPPRRPARGQLLHRGPAQRLRL